MFDRSRMKQAARQSVKRHYVIFVAVCLAAAVLGVNLSNAVSGIRPGKADAVTEGTVVASGKTSAAFGLADIVNGSSPGRMLEKSGAFGRTRGVFASLLNMTSSGAIIVTIVSALASVTGSENAAVALVILLGLAAAMAVWIFGINVYRVIAARIFLEGRTYEKIPADRFLFLMKARKWLNASLTMLLTAIFQTLWWITIVGGIVKSYSYRMVPYIVAENPSIPARRAITLSRKMMDGHKWECFRLELSLIGWQLLGSLTFGIFGVLYAGPYLQAVLSEYYAYLRGVAREKQIGDSGELNDTYLFEKAPKERLEEVYADVAEMQQEPEPQLRKGGGLPGLIADVFGVVLLNDRSEQEYEEQMARKISLESLESVLAGRVYPDRLCPLGIRERHKRIETLQYIRHYSVCSLILLYFFFSVIGWLWEVSLHLISDGEFVNRGVLHGPWLPIYGTGGVLILILLNKFRSRPILEFFSAIVVSGCVEYYIAWYLETTHGGQKWWDYSGYFLNLHGRICAEGLLVFGLGGMAIVYLAAPLLDNLIKRISRKVLIPVCAVLLICYAADQSYSSVHPNTGEGITNYTSRNPVKADRERTA